MDVSLFSKRLQSEGIRFGSHFVSSQQFSTAPQSNQLQVGPAAIQNEGIRFGSHFVNPQQFSNASQPVLSTAQPFPVVQRVRDAPSAFSRIIGAQTDDMTNVMHQVLLLLNLPMLAPGLALTDKRGTYTTVQRYIDHLREQRIYICD